MKYGILAACALFGIKMCIYYVNQFQRDLQVQKCKCTFFVELATSVCAEVEIETI